MTHHEGKTLPMDVPLAGVIGWPIAQSRSPILHRHWLDRYRIAGHYVPLPIRPENLADALALMPKMGFVGANVTIPHKQAVLEIADTITDCAAEIGAANTLTFDRDGKIHADNTDGYGFITNLHQNCPGWIAQSGPAAVIGAGGAARAVVSALLTAGVPQLRISNRTRHRAEQIKAEFGDKIVVYDWAESEKMMENAATLVNASSLGMTGQSGLDFSFKGVGRDALVTDLVYAPLKTQFLIEAETKGCQTVDGLGMLLHQAVPGFERWFGHRPQVDHATREAVLG